MAIRMKPTVVHIRVGFTGTICSGSQHFLEGNSHTIFGWSDEFDFARAKRLYGRREAPHELEAWPKLEVIGIHVQAN